MAKKRTVRSAASEPTGVAASSKVTSILGIDIGGTGIKGAPVDIKKGVLLTERFRLPTPQPAKPQDVAQVVAQLVEHFQWKGPIGITFPAIIKSGVPQSAANVDPAWIGTDARALFEQATGCPVVVINDADAAGIAEMSHGAGKNQSGVVILLTLGTGIGSAIFINGQILPNTELGHLEINGVIAEKRASARVKEEQDLSWKKYARLLDDVITRIEFYFSPDLIILGGGISKKHEKFFYRLNAKAPIVPAALFNNAGIVGGAMAAARQFL